MSTSIYALAKTSGTPGQKRGSGTTSTQFPVGELLGPCSVVSPRGSPGLAPFSGNRQTIGTWSVAVSLVYWASGRIASQNSYWLWCVCVASFPNNRGGGTSFQKSPNCVNTLHITYKASFFSPLVQQQSTSLREKQFLPERRCIRRCSRH